MKPKTHKTDGAAAVACTDLLALFIFGQLSCHLLNGLHHRLVTRKIAEMATSKMMVGSPEERNGNHGCLIAASEYGEPLRVIRLSVFRQVREYQQENNTLVSCLILIGIHLVKIIHNPQRMGLH